MNGGRKQLLHFGEMERNRVTCVTYFETTFGEMERNRVTCVLLKQFLVKWNWLVAWVVWNKTTFSARSISPPPSTTIHLIKFLN